APPSSDLSPPPLHDALPISPAGISPPRATAITRSGIHPLEYTSRASSRAASPNRDHGNTSLAGGAVVLMTRLYPPGAAARHHVRSEEHTSELQSRFDLVCRL